jgi:hypothetical protein
MKSIGNQLFSDLSPKLALENIYFRELKQVSFIIKNHCVLHAGDREENQTHGVSLHSQQQSLEEGR